MALTIVNSLRMDDFLWLSSLYQSVIERFDCRVIPDSSHAQGTPGPGSDAITTKLTSNSLDNSTTEAIPSGSLTILSALPSGRTWMSNHLLLTSIPITVSLTVSLLMMSHPCKFGLSCSSNCSGLLSAAPSNTATLPLFQDTRIWPQSCQRLFLMQPNASPRLCHDDLALLSSVMGIGDNQRRGL